MTEPLPEDATLEERRIASERERGRLGRLTDAAQEAVDAGDGQDECTKLEMI